MSDPAMMDQLAKLNLEVQGIEARFGQGQVSVATLEAIKCALDEVRLRLWGLLMSNSGEAPEAFHQRFRLRRATELCARLTSDLRSGVLPKDHSDIPDMHKAAADLALATE
ncbi:MAG TPA: hypothetical protein VGP87_15340 [Gemmatimonadales bacterium]|jgi:hypothetical protein|nr:hypothetical protein [Gemmatimonadales bacterium]